MMKKVGVLIWVLIMTLSVFGQSFTKKQQSLYEEATEAYEITDYMTALDIYTQLHKFERDFSEMNFRMGICVMKLGGELNEAVYYFQEAASADYPEAYYQLGLCYHQLEEFDDAVKNYQYYKETGLVGNIDLTEINRHIDISNRASQLKKSPVGVDIENVGSGVNSKYADYVPVVSKNDSIMIFTSRREGSTGGEKDPYGSYFEDIYYSFKEHGEWQTAQKIGGLNTVTHDASVGLSPDGQTLIMFRTNEDLTGGDLYETTFNKSTNAWGEPKLLDENINSEYAEYSASVTEDGNTMYFSSNRPGGFGGRDIYRCVRFGNNEWSLPVNLGAGINTPYDDDTPFIAPDDKTLYFSSQGHTTIGGYDIFKVNKSEDGNGWSVPQNMGYPINTASDDRFFVITGDEKTGYYSSGRKDGYGGYDIYTVHLVDKNQLVVIVKGELHAMEGDHEIPMKAKITVLDEDNNEVQGVYKSNPSTGKFLMTLTPYRNYKLIVSEKGYETVDKNLFYPVDENFMEFDQKILLEKEVE